MTTLRTCTAVAVPALILLASNLSSRASGVESGNNSIPANASSQMPSCQQCHSGSGPSVGRTNGPTTHLTASLLVLAALGVGNEHVTREVGGKRQEHVAFLHVSVVAAGDGGE